VKAPGIVQRHPELRWLGSIAFIVAAVALVSTTVSGVFRERSALPVTGPDQLVDQLRAPHMGGYSGTILAQVDLGLPRTVTTAITAAAPAGALLRGSHTLRYWYGDDEHQRVAVIGQTSEQDVFRNGSQVWHWDTSTHVARRSTVADSPDGAVPLRLDSPAALTPPELARRIFDTVGATSDTVLRSGGKVAGRPTYELVVHPDSATSLIDSVTIELDGKESVPLGVQIFAAGGTRPVLDVSFTDVAFGAPAAQNFTFRPPAGARVETGGADPVGAVLDKAALLGSGWNTVVSYRSSSASGPTLAALGFQMLGSDAAHVKGTWGSGRLLRTPALSVLVTAKGQVVAGAVRPDVLYRYCK
jgi:outer membrane lipoprotein-sorting protein